MAYSLSAKVIRIEQSIALLSYFYDRLSYLCPPTPQLIESAVESEMFPECTYLSHCHQLMCTGSTFLKSWEQALECCHDSIGKEECMILGTLAPVLGTSNLETQLSSIAYTRERLQARLISAREYKKTHTKLYQTLGILLGIGIAILLG